MKYVLGIDVGGTKIAAGLVDKNYGVRRVYELSTSQSDLLKQIIKLIGSYKDFDAIGLAMPGVVRPNGFVNKLPNLKNFKTGNLKNLLEAQFNVPVHVMNDAKAFALAEATIGVGKLYPTVVGVILGTGIGTGLIKHKKVYVGKNPAAGEMGHTVIAPTLTLEQLMKKPRQFKSDRQAAEIITRLFSMIIPAAHPDIIIFGGGRTHYRGINQIIKQSLYLAYPKDNKTVVRVSKLKHAGIIGAALPLLRR